MSGFRTFTLRRLLPAAAVAPLAALTACATAPDDRQASWPPRLHAADERLQAGDSAREQRDRALDEAGVTVLLDRPYH